MFKDIFYNWKRTVISNIWDRNGVRINSPSDTAMRTELKVTFLDIVNVTVLCV